MDVRVFGQRGFCVVTPISEGECLIQSHSHSRALNYGADTKRNTRVAHVIWNATIQVFQIVHPGW
jgi:hypothetical protein